MNPTPLVKTFSSDAKSAINFQKNTSRMLSSKEIGPSLKRNRTSSLSLSDSLSLNESDYETCKEINILSSTFNTTLKQNNSYHYNPYLKSYNDDILSAIPETRANVEDNSFIDKAKDIFQNTKILFNIYKYQIKKDKSILPQILMKKSIDRTKEFTPFNDLPNTNEEVYSNKMVDLSSNDLSSEITFSEETIEQNKQEKPLYNNTSRKESHPKLMRTESLSSSEFEDYLNRMNNPIANQNDNVNYENLTFFT